MKKIIAVALCLGIASPCFAAPNFRYDQPCNDFNRPHVEYRQPHMERSMHEFEPAPGRVHHRTSPRTKTLAAVAGVGIAAALISAIVD